MKLDTTEPLLGYSDKQVPTSSSRDSEGLGLTEARGGVVQMFRGLRNRKSPRWILFIFFGWAFMICTVFYHYQAYDGSQSGGDPGAINEDTMSNASPLEAAEVGSGTNITSPSTMYPPLQPEFEYIAMCVAVRDQVKDLPEFLIHHYHHFGIRRFYIMDDGSNPPLSTFTDYGIPLEHITFQYFDSSWARGDIQLIIYDQCQKRFGTRHTWIANFDVDEFLELKVKPLVSLSVYLKAFEYAGALGVSWITHNSNGHLVRQVAGLRKSYLSCIWDSPEDMGLSTENRHIKSIVNTQYYSTFLSPHHFLSNSSKISVGEDHLPTVDAFRYPITRNSIALHHYALKSRAEFDEKLARFRGDSASRKAQWFNHVDNSPKQDCPELKEYWP